MCSWDNSSESSVLLSVATCIDSFVLLSCQTTQSVVRYIYTAETMHSSVDCFAITFLELKRDLYSYIIGEMTKFWLHTIRIKLSISLVPRPSNRRGKAWYTLFVHAFNFPQNFGK